MPRKKFIDRKTATTFSLVYRAQNDPLIHDQDASDMVFAEKANPNRDNKVKRRADLDAEFAGSVRGNEGEAAAYGVYYDDSGYDYMQHLRDLGGAPDARFVEATPSDASRGGRNRGGLDAALDALELDDGRSAAGSRASAAARGLLPAELLPSEFVRPRTYQDMQDVPDAIAGLRPDMDPRLREALEALDDDAFVDDDEGLFEALARDAEELDAREFEAEGEGEGWESDRTVTKETPEAGQHGEMDVDGEAAPSPDWMRDFDRFKRDAGARRRPPPGAIPADLQSAVTGASSVAGLRRKKRRGALTASTGYSMTSSVLARTEGQAVIDRRFERLQEAYDADDDDAGDDAASNASGLSRRSGASRGGASVVREDFDSIMDEFLGGGGQSARRRGRGGQTGMEQLREIRGALGPALVRRAKT
jgi:protein LTV1